MTATLERTAAGVDLPALQSATAWAARAPTKNPPHPSLLGAMLQVRDGEMTLSAFNGETYCTATVDAEGDLGPLLVNGTLLATIADKATRSVVEMVAEGSELAVKAGRDRYRLRLMVAEEYPTAPEIPAEAGAAYGLGTALARIAHAAGDEPSGDAQLQCVLLHAEGGRITLYTCDRHRFGRAQAEWDGEDFEILIDARKLLDVARPLGEEIRLGWTQNLLSLSADGRTAVLRRNAGTLASVTVLERHFGQAWDEGHADVDRDDLLDGIARATPTVDREHGVVDLHFEPGGVSVASQAEELGEAAIPVAAEVHLPTGPAVYRVHQPSLTDALRSLPSDVVRIAAGRSGARPSGAPCLVLVPLMDAQSDFTIAHSIAPRRRTT